MVAANLEKLLEKEEFLPKRYNRGDVVEGKVIKKNEGALFLDIGAKSEGLVSADDFEGDFEKVSEGDRVLAKVIQRRGSSGLVVLSVRDASDERTWRDLREKYENGERFDVRVTSYNEGGLIVELTSDLDGFLPISHLDWSHFPVDETNRAHGELSGKEAVLSSLVGENLVVKIIEMNPEQERVVLSEKKAMAKEGKEQAKSFWSELEEGETRVGIVTGIVPFGLFVRLEGSNVEGLVHVSEISWSKVSDPGETYDVGDRVNVQVLSFDTDEERISLSIKALKPNPWEKVRDNYQAGDLVTGKISKVTPYGAFLELEEGVEGLIHVSETLGPLSTGEKVTAKIIEFKPEEQRLGLSLRQVEEAGE
ncbi:MAG: S1 RNA-binding domain-containing protein [Patescibacteria group bacterium]|nr:S1 RNA-binding domain-containing protein [Patescibacteria group bacterium]